MTASLRWSGAHTATEGDNITLTVDRFGDPNLAIYVDIFPILDQGTINQNDINWQTQRMVFSPGIGRNSVSFSSYKDGMAEQTETIKFGYNLFVLKDGVLSPAAPDEVSGISNDGNLHERTGNGPWTILLNDSYRVTEAVTPPPTPTVPTFVAAPAITPTPAPSVPSVPVVTVTNNIDNSVTNNYTDNSVTTNYVNSFNTDNSVNTYSLSYIINANDYSIGKTISGNGILRGTGSNDLLTGGSSNDRLFGDMGNDELIGGGGKDSFYGGAGSNVFNAGASSSRRDSDRLYIQREANANTADIIEAIGKSDRVYIQGSTGDLSVRSIEGGLGIFDSGVLQAVYTGGGFNANTLTNQLTSV